MEAEFKFPPGITPARDWCGPQLLDTVGAIQRDAVTAARREVASQVAAGLQFKARHDALVESVKVKVGFGERLRGLLAEFNDRNTTPPEILAEYLQNCLSAFNGAQHRRQEHFERPEFNFCVCHYTTPTHYYGGTPFCAHCQKPVRPISL